MLDAVSHAHNKGVIHRDLKPSNIMVAEGDVAKVMDFGIAKILGDRGMTRTGTRMGTVYYMSPEQVRAEKSIDQRTDLYSLGITLYEMLTGKLPYNTDTESEFEIMQEIVERNVPDPRSEYPYISEGTALLVRGLVEKKKENRFVSTGTGERQTITAPSPPEHPYKILDRRASTGVQDPPDLRLPSERLHDGPPGRWRWSRSLPRQSVPLPCRPPGPPPLPSERLHDMRQDNGVIAGSAAIAVWRFS